jgi:hypothetical protein
MEENRCVYVLQGDRTKSVSLAGIGSIMLGLVKLSLSLTDSLGDLCSFLCRILSLTFY